MTFFAVIFGILTLLYLFVLNFVLMGISGSLKDEMRKLGIDVRSNSDMAEMTNSNFWSEIRKVNAASPLPSIRRALKTRKVLYTFGALFGIFFVLANLLKI